MPTARYWRLMAFDVRSDLVLGPVRLKNESGYVDGPAIITATESPAAGSVSGMAVETVTFAQAVAARPSFAVLWDMQSAVSVTELECATSAASAYLQYLGQGGAWQTGAVVVSGAPPNWLPPLVTANYALNATLTDGGPYGQPALDMYGGAIQQWAAGPLPASLAATFSGANVGYYDIRALVRVGSNLAAFAGDFEIGLHAYIDSQYSQPWCRLIESKLFGALGGWNLVRVDTTNPPALRFHRSDGLALLEASTTDQAWHYINIRRRGANIGMLIDGALAAVGTSTDVFTAPDLAIGGNLSGQERMAGRIANVMLINGYSRPVAAGPVTAPTDVAWPQPAGLRTRATPTIVAVAAASSPAQLRTACGLTARDMEFGGRASIVGDVGIKGAGGAPDTMVKSRVRLLRQRDGLLARETWSNPATGTFAFDGLDESQQFIALAEDSSGVYAPVAADRRVPGVPA